MAHCMTTDAIDPFAALAQEQIVAPIKARMKAAKTREERRIAKALSDREILKQQWLAWHRKRVTKLRAGRYAEAIDVLAGFLESMTLHDGGRLVNLVQRSSWRDADAETRYLLLGLIDERIVYLRQIEGWAPFDDSLPFSDEESTAFEIIREMLA